METLTPEQEQRYRKFRDAYESTLVWLGDADGDPVQRKWAAIETARRSQNLTEEEERLFFPRIDPEGSPIRKPEDVQP